MNKITLFCLNDYQEVSFLIFLDGIQVATEPGIKNGNVWEAVFPGLSARGYTVVAVSGMIYHGKEELYWNGTDIVEKDVRAAQVIKESMNDEIDHLMSMENGLTPTQIIKLNELYDLMGLDPSKPLTVTKTQRTAGGINQTIIDTSNQTTVIRNP